MQQVIKNRRIVDDFWHYAGDDTVLPPEGDIIVSLSRWLKEKTSLQQRNNPIGLKITNTQLLEDILGELKHFALIALEFPSFSDGRAYTQARLLRERFAYSGEIRATGDVLRDQLYFMERCGFNAFEVRKDKNIQDALNAFSEFTLTYQPAADGPPSAFFPVSTKQTYAHANGS